MFFRKTLGRIFATLDAIQQEQFMTRDAVKNLEQVIADLRSDYTSKFALIGQSAADTQAKIDDAVAKAIKAKEDEDDAAFATATAELKDIMAGHVETVTANTPATDETPAAEPAAAEPAADAGPTEGTDTAQG